jgi:hypothetical protein
VGGVAHRLDEANIVRDTTREAVDHDRPRGVISHHPIADADDDDVTHARP